MVIAYHCIFTVRGFWLPNDERGSWSDYIRTYELLKFGYATKTTDRRSLAKRPFDRENRKQARAAMKYGTVRFTGLQARAVARGFAKACAESGYEVIACSILPDHVHLVVLRHPRHKVQKIVGHLKTRATQQLIAEGIHPFQDQRDPKGRIPSCWVQHGWNVYLDSWEDLNRAVTYVNLNPEKAGLRGRRWKLVIPYQRQHAASGVAKRRDRKT